MIDYSLWFDLLLAVILLILGIYAGWIYSKNRTKYNLALLIFFMILFVIEMSDLIIPGDYIIARLLNSLGIRLPGRIVLVIIWSLLVFTFLFYPNIQRFLNRRKMKNK